MLSQLQNTNRILIADDDPVIIDIVQTLAESEGYEVVTARDGREAFSILQHDGDFRAIILDMVMPHMEGSELLRKMQRETRLSRIPVLMMSSSVDLNVLSTGFGPGAMAFIPKPFTPAQLRNTLRLIALKDPTPSEILRNPFETTIPVKVAATRINVLMIEDNPGEAVVIEAALLESSAIARLSNIEVSHANMVSGGLERLQAGDIDVVLLDLSLPDAEGLETLLLFLEQDAGVPIVVLTGAESDRLATEAMQLGAQGYLVKGRVDAKDIIQAVYSAFDAKQEDRAIGCGTYR